MRLPLFCSILAAFFACSSRTAPPTSPPAPASEPAKAWTAYFGNLHAHSEVSDGVETPAVAFEYAKTEGKLHFMCLSEHNHEVTKAELDQVRAAATASTTSGFVALQGQEYSKLPPGGIGDGNLLIEVDSADELAVGTEWSVVVNHDAGKHECFLIHVDQVGSQDDAWTAPIWIDPALSPETPEHTEEVVVPAGVKYVGSKNSEVYHIPNCKVVSTIKAENKVEYTTEPNGKRLHRNCPQE